jgi:predicted Zn-dependent protease
VFAAVRSRPALHKALGCLLLVTALTACAPPKPAYIPKSPFLDVPLSLRARDENVQSKLAELELARDWDTIAGLAAPFAASDPREADWRVVLGYARLQQKRFAEAIEALAPVVEHHPEEIDGHNLLGEAQRLAGQTDRARQTLERASFAHPNSAVNRFLLGELYIEGNLLERARSAYAEAVRIDPEFGLGWLGLARVLARTGPREDYEVAVKRLATLDPEAARSVPALAAPAMRR